MIVAVAVVCVVQVAVHEVVDVIAVRHGRVATRGAVDVTGLMAVARVPRRAARGMRRIDVDHALVDMSAVCVMEVAVVQVVDVAVVLDRVVSAARPVDVLVLVVNGMGAHGEG